MKLIEKLKDKTYVRAFGLMEELLPGSQECFEKVGEKNCLRYKGRDESQLWVQAYLFGKTDTYAIKPDYQPPEEFVDLEIVEHEHFLGVSQSEKTAGLFMPHNFTRLHCLPSLPNFVEFWTSSGDPIRMRRIAIIDAVAKLIREGKKVYARFLKS